MNYRPPPAAAGAAAQAATRGATAASSYSASSSTSSSNQPPSDADGRPTVAAANVNDGNANNTASSSNNNNKKDLERQVAACLKQLEAPLTREYYRALEIVPEIVRRESAVSDFLATEDGNAPQAALRLANYWKFRKWVFDERWLLPMTQTGIGCLTSNEIALIRTGYCTPVQDAQAGTVLVVDFSRLPEGVAQLSWPIFVYLSTIFAGQTVTFLHVISSGRRPPAQFEPVIFRQFLSSIALRIRATFVCHAWEPGREHLLDFLAFQQRRLVETNVRMTPNQIMADSVGGTLQQLEQRGFQRQSLPQILGGELSASYFDDWLRMRLSLEEIVGAGPSALGRNRPLRVTIPQQTSASSLALAKKSPTSSNSSNGGTEEEEILVTRLPGETDAAFRKRRNAVYARRSYHRKQNEGMVIQNQVTMLETKNNILRQDNQRLENLLQEAQALVDAGMSHDPLQFTDLGDVESVESEESDSILDHL